MFIDTHFSYDGIESDEMGVMIVNDPTKNGIRELQHGLTRTIIESKNRDKSYYDRVEASPLVINGMAIALTDGQYFDEDTRKMLGGWLFQDIYKPFISPDNPDLVYNAIFLESKRNDNSGLRGWLSVSMRCDSPTPYTNPIDNTYTYDLSNNTLTGTTINMMNLCNCYKYYYPKLDFILQGTDTGVSFQNITNNNQTLVFSGLNQGEEITIDNDSKLITSSLGNSVSRLYNCNRNWMKLVQGLNSIKIIGKCKLIVTCSFPMAV